MRVKCLWKSRVTNKPLQIWALSFEPPSPCLLFFKMNSRLEYRSKLSFYKHGIKNYFSERFLSIRGKKMSKDFLSSLVGQSIVSNLTNVRKMTA